MSNLPDNVTEAMIDAHFGRDDCETCDGTGTVSDAVCPDCDGTGNGPTPQELRDLRAEAKADLAHDMERDEPRWVARGLSHDE